MHKNRLISIKGVQASFGSNAHAFSWFTANLYYMSPNVSLCTEPVLAIPFPIFLSRWSTDRFLDFYFWWCTHMSPTCCVGMRMLLYFRIWLLLKLSFVHHVWSSLSMVVTWTCFPISFAKLLSTCWHCGNSLKWLCYVSFQRLDLSHVWNTIDFVKHCCSKSGGLSVHDRTNNTKWCFVWMSMLKTITT